MDVIEHIAYYGVYLTPPFGTVTIMRGSEAVKSFGFHAMHGQELCAAVFLRVCDIACVSFGTDEVLALYSAIIQSAEGTHYLGYDASRKGFVPITKNCYVRRTSST